MALELTRVTRDEQPVDGNIVIREHLYLTEDRTRVVAEGDPAGRWLWAAPGTEVTLREAIRLGAVKPKLVGEDGPELAAAPAEADPPSGEEPDQDAKPEEKAAKQVPNKARKAGPNKAASTGEGE